MKLILYIFLITAIIPSTIVFVVSIQFISVALESNYNIKPLGIISFSLGFLGYLGLLLHLKGLHKTMHKIKISSLVLGLIGICIFIFSLSPKDFWEWLLKNTPLNIVIGFYPIIVLITFLTLTLVDLKRKKRLLTQV